MAAALPPPVTQLVFAQGCHFTRAVAGSVTISWDNGIAVAAVKGASVDYVDPLYYMSVTNFNNEVSYSATHDLARLIAGNVRPTLAMVIVGMRRVCLSFEGATINIAETHTVPVGVNDSTISEDDWRILTTNAIPYKFLLDLGATIMGMNGLSLMLKGHNYLDSDSMWDRLESATDLSTVAAPLALGDYADVIFHDALHAIDAEWKVGLVANVTSPLLGHVNGVLLKRMPGVPAGTTLVFVTHAALTELMLVRGAVKTQAEPILEGLAALQARIRASPLDWCTVFQRAVTARNLAEVVKVEPLGAFVYGMCTKVFEKKVSLLKSAAFKNNSQRHVGMTKLGAEFGETLAAAELGENALGDLFGNLFTAA